MENSKLVDDVTCTVTGAPCIAFGASGLTLDLNGFSITGLADVQTTCASGPTASVPPAVEDGIDLNGQSNGTVRGPGVVQLFRGPGIFSFNGQSITVTGVTTANNCMSGILVGGGSGHTINDNISVRNGNRTQPCGGISLYGGVSHSRLRANRLSGNGYLVQGNNFGIGLEGNGTNNNVVEENKIFGNSNGLFLTATVQGNIIRDNVITGNPSVQVSTDNPSGSGLDIKNLAPPGANAFLGNVCQTAMNATCGLVGPSLNASPNPIPVSGNAIVGVTTLSWNAHGAQVIEIHVGAPSGPLFTRMGSRGSAQTGTWVGDGTTFYLQDVSGGNPLTADYTLATLVVHLQSGGSAALRFRGGLGTWAGGLWALLLVLAVCFVRPRAVAAGAFLLAAVVLAQSSEQQTSAALDRMVAAHKNQQELAQYVFDTQGCKGCHTVGQNGKLGFTARGTETAKGFEGCIAMLTAVSHIASIPAGQRTPQQQKKTSRFAEFGCTFCHTMGDGKMAMTGRGTKLANLHLGCVDIERTLASRR